MKDNLYKPANRFLWSLLAFQGGLVNVEAFKAYKNFVSHVTGDFGHLAISISNLNFEDTIMWSIVPLAFLAGSITSGMSTTVKKIKGHLPQYYPLIFLMSLCYLLIVVLYHSKISVYQISKYYDLKEILGITLLSYACGIQNALFTSASGAIIRTTHLTGLTTDLGIGIANYFSKFRDKEEGKKNKLRLNLILSFTLGGVCGSLAFDLASMNSFLLPMIISGIIATRLFSTSEKIKE